MVLYKVAKKPLQVYCTAVPDMMHTAPVIKRRGMDMKDDFFTVAELAKHFGVNPKTIYGHLWAKGIPAY